MSAQACDGACTVTLKRLADVALRAWPGKHTDRKAKREVRNCLIAVETGGDCRGHSRHDQGGDILDYGWYFRTTKVVGNIRLRRSATFGVAEFAIQGDEQILLTDRVVCHGLEFHVGAG